jgi:hypothetical protein
MLTLLILCLVIELLESEGEMEQQQEGKLVVAQKSAEKEMEQLGKLGVAQESAEEQMEQLGKLDVGQGSAEEEMKQEKLSHPARTYAQEGILPLRRRLSLG